MRGLSRHLFLALKKTWQMRWQMSFMVPNMLVGGLCGVFFLIMVLLLVY